MLWGIKSQSSLLWVSHWIQPLEHKCAHLWKKCVIVQPLYDNKHKYATTHLLVFRKTHFTPCQNLLITSYQKQSWYVINYNRCLCVKSFRVWQLMRRIVYGKITASCHRCQRWREAKSNKYEMLSRDWAICKQTFTGEIMIDFPIPILVRTL